MALLLLESLDTLALACALDNGPMTKAALAIKKHAAYRTPVAEEDKNMMYPMMMVGVDKTIKICRLSSFQLNAGTATSKKAPTIYGGTL
ncbi:Fc.00g094990.m01.CDS01 [Cosmosporella sp. VM-42]